MSEKTGFLDTEGGFIDTSGGLIGGCEDCTGYGDG